MSLDNTNNLIPNDNGKRKKELLIFIIKKVEKGTGFNLSALKKRYSERQLFFVGLKNVATTKKALCEALSIPIEAGCRYKREYEQIGLLKESVHDVICPFTKNPAKLLSTNPDEFGRLTYSNQLKLF